MIWTLIAPVLGSAAVLNASSASTIPNLCVTSFLMSITTLLTSRIEDLRDFLLERQRAASGSFGFSLPMLEHARGHLALYESIVGKERGGFVIRRIHRTIADLAMLDLKAIGFVRPSEQRDLAAQFVAGAFMSVLTWWLDRGAKLPPEEVDGIFRRLTMQGLAAELGKKTFEARAAGG